MRRLSAAMAAAAATVATLGACGGGDDDDAAQEVATLGTDAPAAEQPDDTDAATDGTDATDETDATEETAAPDASTPTDGSEPPMSAPTDPEEAMLAYTECMRDHGIDMPDPEVGEDGEVTMGLQVEPGQEDEMEEAEEECRPLMEAATEDIEIDPEEEAEMREQMLEYAQCMRTHGIDMPDPVFVEDGGFSVRMQEGEQPIDHEDDEFQAAQEACGDDGMVIAGPAEQP